MRKPSVANNKIDLRPKPNTRPITLNLKISTFERLDRHVTKGSWSQVMDAAVNLYLDTHLKHLGGE